MQHVIVDALGKVFEHTGLWVPPLLLGLASRRMGKQACDCCRKRAECDGCDQYDMEVIFTGIVATDPPCEKNFGDGVCSFLSDTFICSGFFHNQGFDCVWSYVFFAEICKTVNRISVTHKYAPGSNPWEVVISGPPADGHQWIITDEQLECVDVDHDFADAGEVGDGIGCDTSSATAHVRAVPV